MRRLAQCLSLMIVIFISASSAAGQQDRSPSEYVATVMAQSLSEDGSPPTVQRIPRSAHDLRRVISVNLSPKLLSQSVELTGTTYRFAESKNTEEVTVIVLQYPSSALCAEKKRSLEPLKGSFAKSEMLVRFSAAQLGKLLVLASSENTGDARIVHALLSLPERFATDTKNYHWTESKQ